jgi:hypothetical protein
VAATCTNKIGTYYRTLVMQWHAPIWLKSTIQKSCRSDMQQ